MGNYTIFLDVRKSKERQASKKFYNKCSKNSSSQIVFRTDNFPKIDVGYPCRFMLCKNLEHDFICSFQYLQVLTSRRSTCGDKDLSVSLFIFHLVYIVHNFMHLKRLDLILPLKLWTSYVN